MPPKQEDYQVLVNHNDKKVPLLPTNHFLCKLVLGKTQVGHHSLGTRLAFMLVLSFCCTFVSATSVLDYDLSNLLNTQGFTMTSGGSSVSSAGDINGDGLDDIIMGTSWANSNTGIAYVWFGKSGSTAPIITLPTFTTGINTGFRIRGVAAGDICGNSVSKAGDVNGDGIGDIIVAAQSASPSAPRAGAGIVYVIFGRRVTSAANAFTDIQLTNSALAANIGFRIVGAATTDQTGRSVRDAGDVNGDGIDDVIVGALYADPPGLGTDNNAGMSFVIFGRNMTGINQAFGDVELSTVTTGSEKGFRILGAAAGNFIGGSVSRAGDVNGDGISDIIIGARFADPPGLTDAGISYVIFGRKVTSPANAFANIQLTTAPLVATVGFRILGAVANDQSGFAVNTAGDINGDGLSDILLGALSANGGTGAAYVVFGRNVAGGGATAFSDVFLSSITTTSTIGFRVLGAAAGDICGWAVSTSGGRDFNDDGVDDIIIGALSANPSTAKADAGVSYVIYGRKSVAGSKVFGDIYLSSISSGSQVGFRILGAAAGDKSGVTVSAAGDVNGDTVEDIIVGTELGSSYVIYGIPASPTSQPSSQPSRQPSRQPSQRPTRQPSSHPSGQPSNRPTVQPTRQPSGKPTAQPSRSPSMQPTAQPSTRPSVQPVAQPSGLPSAQPSAHPSIQPAAKPSRQPSAQPSNQPSNQPIPGPSGQPTSQPSQQPSALPTIQPSRTPSTQPTKQPTQRPTQQPFATPSAQPSVQPTSIPTLQPSRQPSSRPSVRPSSRPSGHPSGQPSHQPLASPSVVPSAQPSAQPTINPSGSPSTEPSSQPSCDPTSQPSVRPSSQPSVSPSMQPNTQPSNQPSSRPTAQPTNPPSNQPTGRPTSQLTAQPSHRTTGLPSSQPSSVPTTQPSQQPSNMPTSQPTETPSGQPSSSPTRRPSAQPSAKPTLQPRGSPTSQPTMSPSAMPSVDLYYDTWVVAADMEKDASGISYLNHTVWVCGSKRTGSMCVLKRKESGPVATQYYFPWSGVTKVLQIEDMSRFILHGQFAYQPNEVRTEVANCVLNQNILSCAVQTYHETRFVASTYVPFPQKLLSVGTHSAYASVTVADIESDTVQSFLYTTKPLKSVVISHALSPPSYVGGFISGTGRSASGAMNYIIAGTVRTDSGTFTASYLYPAGQRILNSAGLVNAMALEYEHPDSFIAGGLLMNDGYGMHAYLLRVNPFFGAIRYVMRYRAGALGGDGPSAGSESRTLSESATFSSVTRGMVRVDNAMYMILDTTRLSSNSNSTILTVLKVNIETGQIIQQVHVSTSNATLSCNDITTSAGFLLYISCFVAHNSSSGASVLLETTSEYLFTKLPNEFVRAAATTLLAEQVPFQRSSLSVSSTKTQIITSEYEYTTADGTFTPRPIMTPTPLPSSQPTNAPSDQPSSSPTAAPSVSPQPTSHPSSSGPTNTYKPTVKPTQRPSATPSMASTLVPSGFPTMSPTARPSGRPTTLLSAQPSVAQTNPPTPTRTPRPTRMLSVRPTMRPTQIPSSTTALLAEISAHSKQGSDDAVMILVYILAGLTGMWCLNRIMKCYLQIRDSRNRKQLLRAGVDNIELSAPAQPLHASHLPLPHAPRGAFAEGILANTNVATGLSGGVHIKPSSIASDSIVLSSLHSSEMSGWSYSVYSDEYSAEEDNSHTEHTGSTESAMEEGRAVSASEWHDLNKVEDDDNNGWDRDVGSSETNESYTDGVDEPLNK